MILDLSSLGTRQGHLGGGKGISVDMRRVSAANCKGALGKVVDWSLSAA